MVCSKNTKEGNQNYLGPPKVASLWMIERIEERKEGTKRRYGLTGLLQLEVSGLDESGVDDESEEGGAGAESERLIL